MCMDAYDYLLFSLGPKQIYMTLFSRQLEECRDILEDFHHGPVKA